MDLDATIAPEALEHEAAEALRAPERILGVHDDGLAGPTVVVFGALHGNEHAGAPAIRRVLDVLARRKAAIQGKLVGLIGNRRAYAKRRRFVVRDLNRSWSDDAVERIVGADGDLRHEDLEQRELLGVLEPLMADTEKPIIFLDLHSSSGRGAPFCCMADVLRNRPIAFAAPVPIVLGLEEVIDGSLLGWLCDRGHVGIAFEGGQHDAASTIDHLESALWMALVAAGSVDRSQVPELDRHHDRLRAVAHGLPRVLEIRHRHVVADDDGFEMQPGFTNFGALSRGMVVAHDQGGPIAVHESGVMMLPRYQGVGDDGFFVARPVSTAWLHLSAVLRRLRLDRVMPRMLGARPHPGRDDHWIVSGAGPRRWVTDVFHLFGYRRVRPEKDGQVFSRRKEA